MKDANATQKLLFALVVLAAVSFAVWSGMATVVEAPVQAAPQGGGLMTPF